MDNGCQINLDEGEGLIIEGSVTDSLYYSSSYLTLKFTCMEPITLNSNPNNYFTYLGIDWVALSCDMIGTEQSTSWEYSVSCVPRCLFTVITSPLRNTFQLASELGLQLYEKSINVELPSSHINILSGQFMMDNRFYSMEKSFVKNNNFTESIFLYTNGKVLYSNTWKEIVSQTATELSEDELPGNTLYMFQDYQMYNLYSCTHAPRPFKQVDYYQYILGSQFKLNSGTPANFLTTYTVKANNIPTFNNNESLLCTYIKRDVKNPTGFMYCLTKMYIE